MGTEVDGTVGAPAEEQDGQRPEERSGGQPSEGEAPDQPVAAGNLSLGVKSVSAAREIDGARAWESSDRLARLAVLVTGSPDRAYRLTRRTLISVGRSGPYVQARRRLLRRAVRTRVDGYATGLLPGLAGPTPAARLWRRLMRLPAVERALVVLTEAEGMADAVAGAVLGLPRVETEQTLIRVRAALEAHAQLTEAERREVFDGPALMPASGVVPTQALARAQRGRRLGRALTALAAVAALAAGVSVVTLARSDRGDEPVRHPGTSMPGTDPARWQARGDLVGDADLLRAAVRVWLALGNRGDQGDRPAVLWAGRLTGERRLVVLAGRTDDAVGGQQVLGTLLDRGDGLALVRTLPVAPTPAFDLGAVDPREPGSRRYLVAPWFSALSVVQPDSRLPTEGTGLLGLHNGLSAAWHGQDDACAQPLLRLTGTGSAGADQADYALDTSGAGPTLAVSDPPAGAPAQAAYLAALHGLVGCVASATPDTPSLAGGPGAAEATVVDLGIDPVWAGKLPDGAAGQALRLSWRIIGPAGDPAAGPVRFAQVFALVTDGSVRYSTVRFGAGPLDVAVDAVRWTSARDRRRYLLCLGGPGVARVDLQPRPKGVRPGGPVVSLGQPAPGQPLSVVGLDGAGRPVAVQPLDF